MLNRTLSRRLVITLSGVVLLFGVVILSSLSLFDQAATIANQISAEKNNVLGVLERARQSALDAESKVQTWLLFRNQEYNAQNSLTLPREISTLKKQLSEQSQREPIISQREQMRQLVDRLVELESQFSAIQKLVPTPAAFSDTLAASEAQRVYATRLRPLVREISSSVAGLVDSRQQALAALEEDYRVVNRSYFQLVGFSLLLFILFVIFIGNYLARLVVRPIRQIQSYTAMLSAGEFPDSELPESDDELGEIGQSVNAITTNFQQAIDLAQRIGKGKFTVSEELAESEDPLSIALLGMNERLKEMADREARRNWAIAGFARFGDVLRRTTDLRMLCDDVISNLARYVKANLGAIFLLNDDNLSDPRLELVSSYAYNKRKFLHRSFALGEGLVGQAALELETIHITQIPENYVILTSGLGEAPPSSLLIVPLISAENLFGVIELASFNRFTEDEVDFVKRLGENIAAVIANVKANEKTLRLLEQSRQLSGELQERSQDLEKSAESMAVAQQELQRSNTALEQQMRKLNQTALELSQSEKRFFTLLENASEIISIFEKDARVRYQSPSMERILGYKPSDLPDFFRYIVSEDLEKVRAFFAEMVEKPGQECVVEFRYRRKDGTIIYLESLGKNLLDDPSIYGLVVNTRDVTERIRADFNAQRRLQFQSLTENSPDLISRYNIEGEYLYVNPTITRYTGRAPSFFIGKNLSEVGLSADETRFWQGSIRGVAESKTKRTAEVTFPSVLGDRIMQVEFIPELNLDNEVATILAVAHDITENKQAERMILDQNTTLQAVNAEVLRQKLEIEEKNLDITESIRYANRIQQSILPAQHLMEQAFGEMMLFFRPRDIVSGDFYWYLHRGDKVFIAAVDCTGHGVPGAFMSLIGNTLLNQIVSEMGILEPARILSQLHVRVRAMLKQTEKLADGTIKEVSSKDGMDIALCRVDLGKKTVQFAGAYRPIYWWHQYDIHEVKGDKFGIGGIELEPGEVRHFTNHELRIEDGDAIYLFSDGFADQFGGPEGKKFTSKRLREILLRNQHRGMREQQKILERHFEEWKGTQSQVDDIILIGLRF